MIVLYKKGDAHTVNGIQCEAQRFQNSELHVRLSQGWVANVSDLEEKKEKLDPEKIRAKAKAANIEDWDKARIGTLQAKLDAKG